MSNTKPRKQPATHPWKKTPMVGPKTTDMDRVEYERLDRARQYRNKLKKRI